MSTKTKKATQEQRQEERLGIQTGSETPEQKVERLKRELAEAKGQAKKTKVPAVRCAHEGCKLYAMQGREDGMCSNHRPAMEHLKAEELEALVQLFDEQEGVAGVVALFVEHVGWAKAQVMARGRLGTHTG